MKLLEISNASVDKATDLVEQLMGDNVKLLKALAEKEEEAAGWKMLHEQCLGDDADSVRQGIDG